jgi:hypothetical protein
MSDHLIVKSTQIGVEKGLIKPPALMIKDDADFRAYAQLLVMSKLDAVPRSELW